MIIIKGVKLPRIGGIALWPFIILRAKTPGKVIINHERIHLRQQLELLILPFYLWYLTEWLLLLIKYRNLYEAYMHISFEKEAYSNESDLKYLRNRPFWSFLKYLQIR
ncbi:hypothetical protein EGI22_03200 [Lacihabitans sp. LS3-19]|uniref:hypothetical protein n=1 Tax=Lacihabitans sp. LS3-19 TaxID=2487335 RepID=UPI0020CD33A2|nr:hypothetical protein [Lacihabitans sp. LS3-19]MCP9766900.1 hypothetical protein [Lacihabitans sp. LS3-19]